MNLRQVDAEQLVQHGTHIEIDGVRLLRAMPRLGQWRFRGNDGLRQAGQYSLNLGITFGNAHLAPVIQGERLSQRKNMLRLIVANQSGAEDLVAEFAPRVAHCRQQIRIALARHNGPNNAHPSHAGNVADHMVQLQIHEGQRFLHVLDMGRSVIQIALTQPQVCAMRQFPAPDGNWHPKALRNAVVAAAGRR